MTESARLAEITDWLADSLNTNKFDITPLKGDASFRHYSRVKTEDSDFILMDAPVDKEPLGPFLACNNRLEALDVNVPHIYHQDESKGLLLMSDFGPDDYASQLNNDNADKLYQEAMLELIKIQQDPHAETLPAFDQAHMQMELQLFDDWFINAHLKQEHDLSDCYQYIIDEVLQQPYVATHRDYHSRNLMVTDTNRPGVLDHQDMVYGPVSYDLVSLLKDCYIAWPEEKVQEWVTFYLERANLSFKDFQAKFEITGIQRHLKATGIFARLSYLYNNDNYLQYIPQTLKYIEEAADRHTKLTELARLIRAFR